MKKYTTLNVAGSVRLTSKVQDAVRLSDNPIIRRKKRAWLPTLLYEALDLYIQVKRSQGKPS
jgi:hypothetical protein